ncbi:hypothetical protein CPB83DRAFT_855186 [Crepidotus variabilis]|uniref:Peptide hydrolase n=1 Tax=Crepidotus variabilis TaxID=179855 RepID=A0A9P6EFM4_9AGAR|nr:hypothetical protein CPB83DRAFT_855186 [Crepidotus variabilis]
MTSKFLSLNPFTENSISGPCVLPEYYGIYLDAGLPLSLVTLDQSCAQGWGRDQLPQPSGYSFLLYETEGKQLVWLEKASIDKRLEDLLPSNSNTLTDFWTALPQVEFGDKVTHAEDTSSGQQVLTPPRLEYNKYDIHYETPTAALLSIDAKNAKYIDTLIPPFWKSKLVPVNPSATGPLLVAPKTQAFLRNTLRDLNFDPVVASIVGNISLPQIKNDAHFLTGEDSNSGIISRHSFTTGALKTAEWLLERVEGTGAKCRLMPFLEGFAPNVICRYDAIKKTNATVIVSGHYDSRGSFGMTRAPGGDDDGSGTTGVLSIARTIGRRGVKFHSNVELCFFAGEEQGLLGSKAYALELSSQQVNVTMMIQADMTAYRVPGEPLQLGLPERIGTPEVTELVGKAASLYSPELTIGLSSACCSDHQSFWELGYPSTQVFERAGPIADPMYHNSGDLTDREGYSFEQLYAIAKVQFASLLHVAGFEH